MSISYYEGRKPQSATYITSLVTINAAFAALCVFGWRLVGPFLHEPLTWALMRTVGPAPDLFEQPFVFIWIVPFAAAILAWSLEKSELRRIGSALAAVPPLLLLGILLVYHFDGPDLG